MAFNIPNIFIAGTKAVASEVNENFNVIKDEINLQKDDFASLKNEFETVSNYVNGDMKEELVNLIKACNALFCVNSGHTNEEGNADLLAIDTINENRIVFKIGEGNENELESLSFTNANGERATRTQLTAIDLNDGEDGEYIIYGKIAGSPYATKGKLYSCKKEPALSSGDVWLDTSKIPFKAWYHNGISKRTFEDIPLGTATIKDGKLKQVSTFPYNQNGFDINSDSILSSETNLVKNIIKCTKPNYSSATEKAINTDHIAEKDGFLVVKTDLGGQESAVLKMGSMTFNYNTTNSYDVQTFVYPIGKGTNYRASENIRMYFLSHIS